MTGTKLTRPLSDDMKANDQGFEHGKRYARTLRVPKAPRYGTDSERHLYATGFAAGVKYVKG